MADVRSSMQDSGLRGGPGTGYSSKQGLVRTKQASSWLHALLLFVCITGPLRRQEKLASVESMIIPASRIYLIGLYNKLFLRDKIHWSRLYPTRTEFVLHIHIHVFLVVVIFIFTFICLHVYLLIFVLILYRTHTHLPSTQYKQLTCRYAWTLTGTSGFPAGLEAGLGRALPHRWHADRPGSSWRAARKAEWREGGLRCVRGLTGLQVSRALTLRGRG